MSKEQIDNYVADFESLRQQFKGDKLTEQRQAALSLFRENGFPTTRQEDWKYTDVRQIAKKHFSATAGGQAKIEQAELDVVRFQELDCHELVFVNGVYSAELSKLDALPDLAVVCDMATAMEQHAQLLEQHLSQYADNNVSAFTALNTAFVQHGVLIYLPRNVIVDKPINILYLSRKQEQEFASHLRNVVIMEDNAEATIIESYIGLDDANYFTNAVTEIALDQAARLQHYKLQQESINGYHIGNLKVRQGKDSQLQSHSISLGGSLVRNDIHSLLDAEGASINLNGLYMTKGKQHVDNHTRVDHLKPNTFSTENYRGVLNDRSRAVFNGKVIVHQDAQKIEAHQNNANLLLSDDAEIDTKPELEIYADDVKCSHGATVGQLDKDMMFYLRSRAIDKETAKSLLTFAFAEEVIRLIDLEPIRNRLEYLVVGQLPDADLIREFTNE
ncbi:MAG: Fe-S cluster assembly protein SufD [Gammaproteobacteria bacterium]